MKYFVYIFLLGLLNNAFAQDIGTFTYNRKEYIEVANNYLQELYYKEKNSKTPLFTFKIISDRYLLQDLQVIPLPVFYLKDRIYNCGDNLEDFISLVNDPYFQSVLVSNKTSDKIGKFEIFDSHFGKQRFKDNINNEVAPLHGRPVSYDSKKIDNKLESYMKKNPSSLVFLIKGFQGYWSIKQGKVFKLSNRIFRIKETDGSQFICENFGHEYINDIIKDEFRTGKAYERCSSCKKSRNKLVLIKVE